MNHYMQAAELFLQPGDVVELRALGVPSGNGFVRNYSGYFSEAEALAKAADQFDKQQPQYCSVTINPVNPALFARAANKMKALKKGDPTTSDDDIVRRRWLPIDLDPVRPAGISSTEDEKQAAIELSFQIMLDMAADWGEPVAADSGNGIHLLYPIDLPNDEESGRLVLNILNALAAKYDSSSVKIDSAMANASRILKLYGTTARKGDDIPDRPHRRSGIISAPEQLQPISIEALAAIGAAAPKLQPERRRPTGGNINQPASVFERARAYVDKCEPAIEGQGGDRVTFRVACVLVNDFGLPDDDALLLMQQWNRNCQPPWSDRDLEDKIQHAHDYAKKPAGAIADQQLPVPMKPSKALKAGTVEVKSNRDLYNPAKNTDQGNAERLVEGAAGTIRHCAARGWYVWRGSYWEADEVRVKQLYRLNVVDAIYSEVAAADADQDPGMFKALSSHAKRSESARSMASCLQMAACMEEVELDARELDKDPYLYSCANATIDLKTCQAKKHDPADMITRHSSIKYDSSAKCPTWERFLQEIFDGDNELIQFVQTAVGYSLTGSTKEQKLFMLYGTGRNGKSVFMNTIAALMGTYAMETPPETLMRSHDRSERPSNDVARLAGARLVATNETEEGQFLAESKVKAMTGDDVMIARFLHKEFFEFRPQFKLWIRTNHKPRIKGSDEGIWRRIRLVPFGVQIAPNKVDPDLGDKLKAELPGILNWAIEGCFAWQQIGLQTPAKVADATEDYRSSQDLLGAFLNESCVVDPRRQAGIVKLADLYAAYKEWCDDAGERAMSKRNLSFRLSERGFVKRRSGKDRQWCWDGIRLDDGGWSHEEHESRVVNLFGDRT